MPEDITFIDTWTEHTDSYGNRVYTRDDITRAVIVWDNDAFHCTGLGWSWRAFFADNEPVIGEGFVQVNKSDVYNDGYQTFEEAAEGLIEYFESFGA